MTNGKIIALAIWIFVDKVMSVLSNTRSSLVIAIIPRSKCLNFMDTVTVHIDFGIQERKSDTVFTFSISICHEVMGLAAMIFLF